MELALVLVHLGDSKCDHLWLNARRLSNIWPDLNIWIILDGEANIEIAKSLKFNVFDYRGINKFRYKKIEEPAFRNGFWDFTTERIFALFRFQEKNPQWSVLHIENDILLMKNFPFEYFKQIQLNSWMKVSEDHDSAAIMLLPNLETSHWLENKITTVLQNNNFLTDMKILSSIRENNLEQVFQLPSLENSSDSDVGLFDPGAIGMWLTGEEPRNNFGITKRYNNRFDLEIFGNLKQPLKMIGDNLEIAGINCKPIYNLHIHSKNNRFFGMDAERKILLMVMPISRYIRRYSFSPRILLEVIIEYRSRRKLFSLIAALPGIRVLRNWLRSKVRSN